MKTAERSKQLKRISLRPDSLLRICRSRTKYHELLLARSHKSELAIRRT